MTQQPIPPATQPPIKRALGTPPLDRRIIDHNIGPLRVIAGLACVGYSAVAAVVGVFLLLYPAIADLPGAWAIALVSGIVVAVLIIVVQITSAEHAPLLYFLSLFPDTWFGYQPIEWLGLRMSRVDGTLTADELLRVIVVGVVASYLVSRFGEWFLFGRRRTLRWKLIVIEGIMVVGLVVVMIGLTS